MSNTLLVFGGSGFIGSQVCRIAVEEGHDVISVSRHGRPNSASAPWADRVQWVEANILEPETWREQLSDCDAVVHCVGILSEDHDEGFTFERVNGDSVEIAAWEAKEAGVDRFVFVSAKETPPFVSPRYLAAKRIGETALHRYDLREIILRPNIVFGPQRPATQIVGGAMSLAEKMPGLGHRVHEDRPLRVEQVATAIVKAATDLDYEGVISLDNIEYVAGDDWERYAEKRTPIARLRPLLIGGAVAGAAAGAIWGVLRHRD
jgi:nucleoside-diphosphate-sugar epimerase